MAGTKYCMGCMQPLTWDGRCRFCDFAEEEYKGEKYYLPLHSTLKNGEYLIGRVLGRGGFGITYIGLDMVLLQRVAIKEFYPEHFVRRGGQNDSREVMLIQETQKDSFEQGMDSFLQEGRTLAKFSSLHAVAGVKTFFQENGTAYLVMEYVDGMSVKDYVRNFGAMNPETVLSMLQPVIRDLQCIHEEHIFHRDISADNLIIDTNGKLTLIDFGAAKQILAENERTNTILYKPGYSALEQYIASGKQGGWTDVYGLCASVYYMLTGLIPESALERIAEDAVQPLYDIESLALSKEISSVIWRGMAVERKDRYQSMAELYQALYGEQILEALPVRARESFELPEKISYVSREKVLSGTRMKRQLMAASQKRRRKWQRGWILGLSGAVLLVLAVCFWQGKTKRMQPKDNSTGAPFGEAAGSENMPAKTESAVVLPQESPASALEIKQNAEKTTQPKAGQTSAAKRKRTPKASQASGVKIKQTPKPGKKAAAEPAAKETAPSLRLQEDDHVAGDLSVLE